MLSISVLWICGIYFTLSVAGDSRILGGTDTQIEKIPYQVSIRYNGDFICGGSIISRNRVLSAAHCFAERHGIIDTFLIIFQLVINDSNMLYSIGYGSNHMTSNDNVAGVLSVRLHDKYNPRTLDHDLAIVRTLINFEYSATVQPIAIADRMADAGDKVTISGWGLTSENGESSKILQSATVFIVDRTTCQKQYENLSTITENMICASRPEGGTDACQGDSGGPLAHNGSLYGVVSFGNGCGRVNFSGVYANVVPHRDWIHREVARIA